jgi:hypothetical protein
LSTQDEIPIAIFSPDGASLAYAARRKNAWYVIVDGQEISIGHSRPSQLTFSPDGAHLGFVVTSGGKDQVVVDGESQLEYKKIDHLNISRGAAHVAYAALNDSGKWTAICDATATGKEYESGIDRINFSPNGEHLDVVGILSNDPLSPSRFELEHDGTIYGPYHDLTGPVYAADGKDFLFAASRTTAPRKFVTRQTGVLAGWFRVTDGKEERVGYERQVLFGGGSNHLLCFDYDAPPGPTAAVPPKTRLEIDGRRLASFDTDKIIENVTLSPNGLHVASIVNPLTGSAEQRAVKVDSKVFLSYARIGPPLFSPDSVHVAYAAMTQAGVGWQVCIDGTTHPPGLAIPTIDKDRGEWNPATAVDSQKSFGNGQSYDGQLPYHFDSDGSLVYFRIADGHLYRVHWKPDDAATQPASRP